MNQPSGAAPTAQYTYPALGDAGFGEAQPQSPQPLVFAPAPSRPAPSDEAVSAADALVRAALARKPSGSGRSMFQPGAIPLRPLSLSEIYNGAVAVLRSNPKAVLGFSVVVLGFGALLQVAALAPALRWALRIAGAFGSAVTPDSPDSRSTISFVGALANAPVTAITATLIAGCVMPVLARALAGDPVPGRRSSARAVWRETRARALPLAGLAFLVLFVQALIVLLPILIALFLVVAAGFPTPGAVVLLIFAEPVFLLVAYVLGVLLSLSAPAMMSERLGVFAACRRSVRLARRGFWKLLGFGLLTRLVTSVVGLSLSLPFTVVGEMLASDKTQAGHAALWSMVLLTLGQLLAQSILMPFTASVTALLYVDQRMRQEAYDLVLLSTVGREGGEIGREA
ncbi:hypothetical protein [Segniliparus rugosus]|uniref:Glycerophosphoryl diester phosphodiesterase membrane domain-containing protein n=1 Tax=Segniliparus rugosus (strain ATCC BAA-974 / DSM 45345 / CCUG 50838 / CIP 108380 / JCM 13579 / CDC 945) TaxID=679197 RepID=E5XSB6_SEGRC|nr:hypothetical protein HMPREF9336_02388 [Segniliparus rugosus ATCC BAA-974]